MGEILEICIDIHVGSSIKMKCHFSLQASLSGEGFELHMRNLGFHKPRFKTLYYVQLAYVQHIYDIRTYFKFKPGSLIEHSYHTWRKSA